MTDGRIMIVDDDRSFVDAVALYLEDHGFGVAKAYTGSEGIVTSRRQDIVLAVVDVHLPDVEGIDVVQALRCRHPSVPVLLISSDDSPETTAKCLAADASVFLAKPLIPKQLLDTIFRLCPPRKAEPRDAAAPARLGMS
jgi:DNA-binding response OmpR family regulator